MASLLDRSHGKLVVVDKDAQHGQVAGERNAQVRLCPFFGPANQ